jgi:hypothetical protein
VADRFESIRNRTGDDDLRVRVRLPDNKTISGFLGLYDDSIAIITAFSMPCVYPVDMRVPLDLQQVTNEKRNPFAFGRTHGGRLMGTRNALVLISVKPPSCPAIVLSQRLDLEGRF